MDNDEDDAVLIRSLRFPALRERYGDLVDAVEAFGRDSKSGDSPSWPEFLTAVSEIGANVLSYAYRDREPGDIEVQLIRFSDRMEARFRDWGAPFIEHPVAALQPEIDDAPGELDEILALAEHGRGLAIARAALTSVEFSRGSDDSNRWRLVKLL
jgi:anti-sigma regulatory factor (Ser/Thr protein kinase)